MAQRTIFVYRYLPMDEKLSSPLCPLRLCGEYMTVFKNFCTKLPHSIKSFQGEVEGLGPGTPVALGLDRNV